MRIIKPVEFDPSEGNFSRASTGTYFDRDGVLRTAAADEPRWNYTFEDGEWVGPELLVEEQRTNLLTYSEQFDNGSWFKLRASVSPNLALAPDGTLTADKLIEGAVTASKYVYKGGSVTEGVAHTLASMPRRASVIT